jgi:hypothetical protein
MKTAVIRKTLNIESERRRRRRRRRRNPPERNWPGLLLISQVDLTLIISKSKEVWRQISHVWVQNTSTSVGFEISSRTVTITRSVVLEVSNWKRNDWEQAKQQQYLWHIPVTRFLCKRKGLLGQIYDIEQSRSSVCLSSISASNLFAANDWSSGEF